MQAEADSGFRWLTTGDEAFAAMAAAIRKARQAVRFETYIQDASPMSTEIAGTLADAARRGVRVQVLIDAFGSILLPDSFWNGLRQAGGEVRWFNPLTLKRFGFRNHRKLLVCDDRLAIIGGFNVAAEWIGDGVRKGWRDLGLAVPASLARDLGESFDDMFALADFRHFRFTQWRAMGTKQRRLAREGTLLLSGPGRGRSPIKRSLRQDLRGAREVRIIAAYFLPPLRIRRALSQVARRGGRVQLILPGKSDVPLMQAAARSLYQRLLRTGVEIYEYEPQILHSKLIIIDDIVYVGSANLDTRSLNINYELQLRLQEPSLADQAKAIFQADLSRSRRIHPVLWRKSRTFWNKVRERWAHFFFAKLDPYVARWQWRRLGPL